jgi:hypothetical protein
VVLVGVADAHPATEVELGERDAVLVPPPCQQVERHLGVGDERVGAEDLGADVGVDPDHLDVRQVEGADDGLVGEPERQGEAELRVVVAGADVLVGVGVDAGGDPQPASGAVTSRAAASRSSRSSSSNESTTMRPRPDLERSLELGLGLVVAVVDELGRVDPGDQRGVQLTTGGDVDR